MKRTGFGLLFALIVVALAACQQGPKMNFATTLTPEAETTAPILNGATPSGSATATLNADETILTINGTFTGLTGPATAAHIQFGDEGVPGPVVCPLTATAAASGTLSGACEVEADVADPANSDVIDLAELRAGNYYVNVHTALNGSGEIRGQLE